MSENLYYNCASHASGTVWNTGSAKTVTYGTGVTLSIISLSAQSGYSTSVNLQCKFNKAGEICGNSTQGPAESSAVEADGA